MGCRLLRLRAVGTDADAGQRWRQPPIARQLDEPASGDVDGPCARPHPSTRVTVPVTCTLHGCAHSCCSGRWTVTVGFSELGGCSKKSQRLGLLVETLADRRCRPAGQEKRRAPAAPRLEAKGEPTLERRLTTAHNRTAHTHRIEQHTGAQQRKMTEEVKVNGQEQEQSSSRCARCLPTPLPTARLED